MRAMSWVPLGTPRGGRPPDAKGVSALGEGGEMRTTSRLQLCRRKPDDGLWARSVRSACVSTAPSGYQHEKSDGFGRASKTCGCLAKQQQFHQAEHM